MSPGELGGSKPAGEKIGPPSGLIDEYEREVLKCLREMGSATEQELIRAVGCSLTDGEFTDHERVRVGITLQIDTIPTLEDAGYLVRNGEEWTLDFLPPHVFEWLDEL